MVVTVVQWFCLDAFRGVLCETFQVMTKALVSQRRGLHLGDILGEHESGEIHLGWHSFRHLINAFSAEGAIDQSREFTCIGQIIIVINYYFICHFWSIIIFSHQTSLLQKREGKREATAALNEMS